MDCCKLKPVLKRKREELVNENLADTTDNESGNYKQHLPCRIPPTEKKVWPQKPCVICRRYGVRHDTRYFCKTCNVALCKSPCFEEFHL